METSLIVKLVDFDFDSESFGQMAKCMSVCVCVSAGVWCAGVLECVSYLHVCSFLFLISLCSYVDFDYSS